MEIEVDQAMAGKTAGEISLPGELMVVMIKGIKGVVLPEPQTKLHKNDVLMAVVKTESLDKVRKKFGI